MEDINDIFGMGSINGIPALPVLANTRDPSGNAFFFDYSSFGFEFLQVPGQSLEQAHTDTLSNTSEDLNPSLSRGPSYQSSTSSFTTSGPFVDDQPTTNVTLDEAKEGDDKLTTPQLSQGQFGDPYLNLPLVSWDPIFGYLHQEDELEPPDDASIPKIVTPEPPAAPAASAAPPTPPSRQRRRLGAKQGKVAGMRKIGACVRCRIRKVECDEKTPCANCVKYMMYCPQVCKNQRLLDLRFRAPELDVWLPGSAGTYPCSADLRPEGPVIHVLVHFEETHYMSTPLSLVIQRFASSQRVMDSLSIQPNVAQAPSNIQYGLPPGRPPPSRQDLMRWSEEQLNREGKSTFQKSIGAFLSAYANSPKDIPQKDLVQMVHDMRCWHKIWQSPVLWANCPNSNQQARKLSELAHLQLRGVAKSQLATLEHQVLEKLDSLLQVGLKPFDVPVWACFWQLILLYRDLLGFHHQLMEETGSYMSPSNGYLLPGNRPCTLSGPGSFVPPPRGMSSSIVQLLEDLYELLIVNYAAYFRNNSPAYLGMKNTSEVDGVFHGDEALRAEFDNVRTQRRVFQNGSFSRTDGLLKEAIVNHEIALDKRRGIKKRGF